MATKKDTQPVAAATETKELTVAAPAGEVALNGLMAEFAEDAGKGFENVTAKDMAIPFISILQKGSPQVDESDAKYVAGAKTGMLFNTVTNELYGGKDGITVIPCHFEKLAVEWRARESGGGIVGRHSMAILDHAKMDDKGKPVSAAGNKLEETAYHFILIVKGDGDAEWAVLAMKSTQLKHSKKWMKLMADMRLDLGNGRKVKAPMASYQWKITTKQEENAQGKWQGLVIEPAGMVASASLYAAAKVFAEAVKGGNAKMADESGENATGTGNPDDVPF